MTLLKSKQVEDFEDMISDVKKLKDMLSGIGLLKEDINKTKEEVSNVQNDLNK